MLVGENHPQKKVGRRALLGDPVQVSTPKVGKRAPSPQKNMGVRKGTNCWGTLFYYFDSMVVPQRRGPIFKGK